MKNTLNMKNKKLIRLTESDLHRIVKESVNRILSNALIENEITRNRYKLIAYLIDPDAEYQKQSLGTDYEKSLRDFQEVERGGRNAISIMLQYRIDSDVMETFDSNEPYLIDRDGDGFYLFKKM